MEHVRENRTILVTGASTGIGRRITERLASAGHFVYAGARNDCDLRALAALQNVHALRLDVTNPNDIAAAAAAVARDGGSLYGLVNNAGVATLGPVVRGNEAEFDLVMAVNVQGTYRMTCALAPQIVAAQGRIVMMGSISGVLAEQNVGAYSMSKHAIEALADSLGAELARLCVHVSIIEPSNVNTSIATNALTRLGTDPGLPDLTQCMDPDAVAAAVELALFERSPKRRYLVVPRVDEARMTIAKQIEQLVQLNEGHRYTLDRDTLVAMLDQALNRSRPAVP